MPDADRPGVPAEKVFFLPLLLADWLGGSVVVNDPDEEDVVGLDGGGNVDFERRVSATVVVEVVAVEPDIAFIIDGLEVQEVGLPWRGFDCEVTPVPDNGIVIRDVEAGILKGIAIRYADGVGELLITW